MRGAIVNGMKKNRVFSIGALLVLAVVLAACRVTVEPQISNRELGNPRKWETRRMRKHGY